jgi:hypothetical protein
MLFHQHIGVNGPPYNGREENMHPSITRQNHPVKTFAIGLCVSLALAIAAGVGPVYADNVSFNSKPNCDSNAILRCGAMNVTELQQKYSTDTKAQSVYTWYNIGSADIANLGSTAVAGSVTKAGNVEVNGKVVATNAISAGYHNMKNSTAATSNGVTFYNSAPGTSFLSERIDAYVILNSNKQFVSAVLASCGNPVKATNVVPAPAPTPPAQQPTPAPAPAPQPAPAPAPVVQTPAVQPVVAPVAPAAPEAPKVLANAGPGPIAGMFAAVSAAAGIGHSMFMRRKRAL